MKSRLYLACFILLPLLGCKTFTPEQIAAMSDDDLCNIRDRKFYNYQTSLDAEIRDRKLDCNPNHRACISYGHQFGTTDYADCRMKLRQMAEERDQMDTMMQELKAIKATPSESSVTIQQMPSPQFLPIAPR
jgi:hypothetical protein